MKLLLVYNSAAHYRESVFRSIDRTIDCDFVFGRKLGNIKQFVTSVLNGNVTIVDNKKIGKLYYQPHVLKLSLRKAYDRFLFLGDTRCISTWLSAIAIRLFTPSKKVYFWTHGWYGKENWTESCLKKAFFRLANGGVFLYGNYARELMVKEGFNPERLFVIHNSLAYEQQLRLRPSLGKDDTLERHFGNENKNLLFIGRLTKVKRLDLLLEALSMTKEKYNLILVGDGTEKESLISITERLGLEDRVWFYGACYDETELGSLIGNSDLCVSPGNVGLTAIHSMVFGTPVLTHDDFPWQMPEFEAIRVGETGCFFHRGDVRSLADAVDAWFSQENYDREAIREKCFEEIDNNWTPEFQLGVIKKHLV